MFFWWPVKILHSVKKIKPKHPLPPKHTSKIISGHKTTGLESIPVSLWHHGRDAVVGFGWDLAEVWKGGRETTASITRIIS